MASREIGEGRLGQIGVGHQCGQLCKLELPAEDRCELRHQLGCLIDSVETGSEQTRHSTGDRYLIGVACYYPPAVSLDEGPRFQQHPHDLFDKERVSFCSR